MGNLRAWSFVLSDLSGLRKAPHLGLTSPQKANSEESKGGDTNRNLNLYNWLQTIPDLAESEILESTYDYQSFSYVHILDENAY